MVEIISGRNLHSKLPYFDLELDKPHDYEFIVLLFSLTRRLAQLSML